MKGTFPTHVCETTDREYLWVSCSRFPERRGQRCRVILARDKFIRVRFEDGVEVSGLRTHVRLFTSTNAAAFIPVRSGTKRCTKCHRDLPLSEFASHRNCAGGIASRCRYCSSEAGGHDTVSLIHVDHGIPYTANPQ